MRNAQIEIVNISSKLFKSEEIYSCVSSAYMWYCVLCDRIMTPIGGIIIYKENRDISRIYNHTMWKENISIRSRS